jgi:hypothetical protein
VVDFGRIALGETMEQRVDLSTTGEGPASVALSTEAPFSAPGSEQVLPGTTQPIKVVFRPLSLGAAHGELVITGGVTAHLVQLTGEGIPACVATDPCHRSTFDVSTRACLEAALPDGASCLARCVEQATCRAGSCIGRFSNCDDGDACTVDACTDDGACVHLPRACQVSNPCKLARCDSTLGCVADDLDDGTACGPATCAKADVCIAGGCVTRDTPGADVNCHYTSVCAAEDYACASTVSERLRCWGAGYHFGSTEPVVGPHLIPGAQGVKTAICGWNPSWLTSSGVIQPVDWFADAGMGRLLEVRGGGLWTHWDVLDERGAAAEARLGSPVIPILGPGQATHVVGTSCAERADGGVVCALSGQPTPWSESLTVVLNVYDGVHSNLVSLGRDGRVITSDAVVRVDGGVTAVGALAPVGRACWVSRDDTLRCFSTDGGIAPPLAWSGGAIALTNTGTVICGLSDAGMVSCWGDNHLGETSDPGTRPTGLVRFADGGITSFGLGWGVVALRGDELLATAGDSYPPNGPRLALLDGGAVVLSASAGTSSLVSLGRRPGVTQVSGQCLLEGGAMKCWGEREPLQVIAHDVARLCPGGWVDTAGRLWASGQLAPVATGLSPQDPCTAPYAIDGDGGVTFGGIPIALPALPSVRGDQLYPTANTAACAVASSEVFCWAGSTSGDAGMLAPVRVAGVHQPVRLLAASLTMACAVSGENGLQCWDMPATGVRTIAVPARIERLGVGEETGCVLLNGGDLQCFGGNEFGQLGFVPNTGQSPVPVLR